jgi:hypothetical protein
MTGGAGATVGTGGGVTFREDSGIFDNDLNFTASLFAEGVVFVVLLSIELNFLMSPSIEVGVFVFRGRKAGFTARDGSGGSDVFFLVDVEAPADGFLFDRFGGKGLGL